LWDNKPAKDRVFWNIPRSKQLAPEIGLGKPFVLVLSQERKSD